MNVRSFFHHIGAFIHSPLPIGGLEISDAFLRYVALDGDRALPLTVRLPPGVLDNGMIIQRDVFAVALGELSQQLLRFEKSQNVVVTLASSHVYTQVIRVPVVAEAQYDATLDVALRANSPLDIASAYYDAEPLGFGVSNEQEFLAAYVDRRLIDPLCDFLAEIGFTVVAIEFPALSLTRAVAMFGRGVDLQQPALLISVVPDGADFIVMRNGRLLFHYWQSFRELTESGSERAITVLAFQSLVSNTIGRTLNFYTSQWGGSVRDAILFRHNLLSALRPVLEGFGLRPSVLSTSRFDDVLRTAPFAFGAALRGGISRRDDVFLSIAPVGTEVGFFRAQFWHFISLWRFAFAVATVGVLLLFLVTDVFLAQQQPRYSLPAISPSEEIAFRDAQLLRDQAIAFNRSVDFVGAAFAERGAFSVLLTEFRRLSGNAIALRRITFQARDRSVALTGYAASGFAAIDFKTTLAKQSRFEHVALPFARIIPEDSGVSFQLTLQLVETPPRAS